MRVSRSGICATDVHLSRGYMGFRGVLGHEFVGVVTAVAEEGQGAWVGRRVVGEINLGCGQCARCHGALPRHCATRTVLGILGKDGCHAEYVTLPVANLHPVPDAVDDARAVFTEPLAAAFEVAEQVHLEPGSRALVLGDGKLGLLVARVLVLAGVDVTVVGRHARKLALAERFGARASPEAEAVPGDADLVVEATGSERGLDRALGLVRPRGTVVLKSTFHGATTLPLAPVVIHEVTLVGSRCGPFAPALRALAAGLVDPAPLVDQTVALSEAPRALEEAQRPGALKVLLDPSA